MRNIKFHDREKEIKDLTSLLSTEPTLITFVYGPINSGKTALLDYLTKRLPKNYVVFYINLRGKFISNYDDFVRALFKLEREEKEYKAVLKAVSEVSLKSLRFAGIPITEGILDLFFKKKTYEDVFEFLEDYFSEIAENKVPVLIVDELQKIGDVKIDNHLIYELFNFFIRLTKELHLCHVFAISSDSLFIERVYSEAMLQGRCRFLLVDDFDEQTTRAFLEAQGQGFTEAEKQEAWEYCGGKPVCLVELANAKINGKSVEREAKKLLKIRTSQILSIFDEIALGKVEYSEKAVAEEFKNFEAEEVIKYERETKEKLFLVGRNVLFIDPTERTIRPQSRLDLLAIRVVLKNLSLQPFFKKKV
ncbi:MAG: ATP-binding protein [Methanophagales archaeon]|nr:ATP-binding protein [Methanophagales archaeon]